MAITVRQSFPDLNLATMLPAIDEVIMAKYTQFPEQYSKFFRVETSSRAIEQTTEVAGFGLFANVPEASNTRYDDPVPGFNKTYLHAQYSLGFKVSKIAMDDDKFGVIRRLSTDLGKSGRETVELGAASVWNQAFNSAFPGPDGVPLCSLSHPLVKAGGVQTNLLSYTTDPDVTSIQLAMTDARTTLDHSGRKVRIPMKRLILPPQLAFVGSELLNSTDRPDTANRATNSLRDDTGFGVLKPVVYEYLTNPHNWFLQADVADTEIRFYWREKFNTAHDVDFDSRSVKTAAWMRYACGFNGFYGVYGVGS